jgi:hypothetical protein
MALRGEYAKRVEKQRTEHRRKSDIADAILMVVISIIGAAALYYTRRHNIEASDYIAGFLGALVAAYGLHVWVSGRKG